MSNESTLRAGKAKAKRIISEHILHKILTPMADTVLTEVVAKRIALNNMTGNTINSYAVGVYVNGALALIKTSSSTIPSPLRRKLSRGQKFYAGSQRWDGETQMGTFTAKVPTNGSIEAERSIAFLETYHAPNNGWTVVVCNGVEYATFQESVLNLDVLTSSWSYMQMFAESYFIPMN